MRANDLMTTDEVLAFFPGKNAEWVRNVLVRPRRVEVVKVGRTRFIVRRSFMEHLECMRVRVSRSAWS